MYSKYVFAEKIVLPKSIGIKLSMLNNSHILQKKKLLTIILWIQNSLFVGRQFSFILFFIFYISQLQFI